MKVQEPATATNHAVKPTTASAHEGARNGTTVRDKVPPELPPDHIPVALSTT